MRYNLILLWVIALCFAITLVSAQSTLDQAKGLLPDFSFGNAGLIITIFVVAILVVIVFGVGIFFLVRYLRFNREVTIWEDVEGHDDLEPVGKDKAMLVKVGAGGTELLYLRKRKVYRGAYGKRIGKKRYLFVIGKDGYWYNVTLGGLSTGTGTVAINPTSTNMRYQNESLQELIKNRFDKPSWWSQYGQIVVNIVFFMLVAVMFWLYFAELKKVAPVMSEAAKALQLAAEAFKQGVGGLDAVQGSGGFNQI